MRKIPSIIRLIGAVFTLSILPAHVYALTPDQVFDKVKDSIVVVKTLDSQGKVKGQGSGVLISTGRVATNCHVVEGGISYQVGRGKQLVRATLYAEDRNKDICLLDATSIAGKPAQLGKAADLKVGVPVYAVGAPQGLELSLSDGIVSQLRGGPPPWIQTTAAISPGSSGGGLFDGEGQLVGLTTLFIKGAQSLNFAMPVEWISDVTPGKKPVTEGYTQTEWLKRGIALEELKDWDGLLDWCLKWTKSEPENSWAWYGLGIAYENLKRYDDAIEAYLQTLRIDPKFTSVWFYLALAYSDIKRYNDAIEAYRQVLFLNPKHASAWNNLGNVYRKHNRYNEAIEAHRQALRIDPQYAIAWYNLALAYDDIKRYDDAIEAYRQVLLIDQENVLAWENLGATYGKLNRYDDATEAFRQAIRINPKHASAWYNLGFTYILSGNRTSALEVIKELRRLDPARADKLFNQVVPR